jgi:hypothetical protein
MSHVSLPRFVALALVVVACGRLAAEEQLERGASAPSADSGIADSAADVVSGADASFDSSTPSLADAEAGSGPNTGAPCTGDEACTSTGQSSAPGVPTCYKPWTGGYCRSFCAAPVEPQAGVALARSDCPVGSVCLLTNELSSAGTCLRECTSDSDCREAEGYYCRRTFGDVTTPKGVCSPSHCKTRGCKSADCDC